MRIIRCSILTLTILVCTSGKNENLSKNPYRFLKVHQDLHARLISPESSYKKLEFLKRIKKFSSLVHVDPVHWDGHNASQTHLKYPGLIFLDTYKGPSDAYKAMKTQDKLSLIQLEDIFYKSIEAFHVLCMQMVRYGNAGDGGWEVCVTPPFNLSTSTCLVYSFGIGFDFSFDDDIANRGKCHVRSFDPSMHAGDHVRDDRVFFYQLGLGDSNTVTSPSRWKLKTLSTIRHLLNHDEVVIDVLKIDIEFAEWQCLENMLFDQSLSSVKQLILEVHSPLILNKDMKSTQVAFHYRRMLGVLQALEKSSFRRFFYHRNSLGKVPSARGDGSLNHCCYELYYINIKFL